MLNAHHASVPHFRAAMHRHHRIGTCSSLVLQPLAPPRLRPKQCCVPPCAQASSARPSRRVTWTLVVAGRVRCTQGIAFDCTRRSEPRELRSGPPRSHNPGPRHRSTSPGAAGADMGLAEFAGWLATQVFDVVGSFAGVQGADGGATVDLQASKPCAFHGPAGGCAAAFHWFAHVACRPGPLPCLSCCPLTVPVCRWATASCSHCRLGRLSSTMCPSRCAVGFIDRQQHEASDRHACRHIAYAAACCA